MDNKTMVGKLHKSYKISAILRLWSGSTDRPLDSTARPRLPVNSTARPLLPSTRRPVRGCPSTRHPVRFCRQLDDPSAFAVNSTAWGGVRSVIRGDCVRGFRRGRRHSFRRWGSYCRRGKWRGRRAIRRRPRIRPRSQCIGWSGFQPYVAFQNQLKQKSRSEASALPRARNSWPR